MKCLFCDIIKGKREKGHILFQDKNHIAVLDIFPIYKGQCFIIPKKHIGSLDLWKMSNADYSKLLVFTKKVEKLLEKALKPKFTCLVVEGTGVDHLHIKLYPIIKIKKWADTKPRKLTPYPGYITTWLGSKAKEGDLLKIAKKIKKLTP